MNAAFSNFWFYGALLCIVAAVGRLWSPPDRDRLPHVLALTGAAVALSGSEVGYPLDTVHALKDDLARALAYKVLISIWAAAAFAVVRSLLAGRGPVRARVLAAEGLLLAVMALGIAVATSQTTHYVLTKYDQLAPEFVNRFTRPARSGGGFSGQAKLGSIESMKGDGGNEVALQAFGKRAPGYLRGKVFVEYAQAEWRVPKKGEEVIPERSDEDAATGLVVLPGRARPAFGRGPDLSVFPSSTYTGHFFLPLEASAFETACASVGIYAGGACWTQADSTGYDAFVDGTRVTAGSNDPDYRKLPDDPAILGALDRAIAKLELHGTTAQAAWRAIQTDFARRYTYAIGIRFEAGSDPLVQFLDKSDHGHCELFASAGTLMLRRMGFAARYVTGFLCQEKGAADDLWLARQHCGHAWVEVFEPEQGGWRGIELTPDSGLPKATSDESTRAWLEALRARARRAWALARRVGVSGVLRMLGLWIVEKWYRWGVLVAVAAFFAWRRWRKRPRPVAARVSVLPAELARERDKLLALERRLARAGLPRAPSETLDEYARRLDASQREDRAAVVSFLRGYASRRYAARA